MITSATISSPPGGNYGNGGILTSFPCYLTSNQNCIYFATPLLMTSIIHFSVVLSASSYNANQPSLPSWTWLTKALEASWIILTVCGVYPVMIFGNLAGYSMEMKRNYSNHLVIVNSQDSCLSKKAFTSIS